MPYTELLSSTYQAILTFLFVLCTCNSLESRTQIKKKKDKCQKKLEKILLLKAIELIFEMAVVGSRQIVLSLISLEI